MPRKEALALLEWYALSGVDEAIGEMPQDRFAPPPSLTSPTLPPMAKRSAAPTASSFAQASTAAAPLSASPSAAAAAAREMAERCGGLPELRSAIEAFEGCALKKTAMHTVFSRGNPASRVMLIGEAPGAEEDKHGIPFCGQSGKLLDTMFRAIGLGEENCYITNTLFWRPPGNRPPTPEELAICRPFVEKHIALVAPKLLVLVGGTAVKSVLGLEQGVTRMRGKQYTYRNGYLSRDIPVMVTFHPSFLLRQPAQKKQAWHDLLGIEAFLA